MMMSLYMTILVRFLNTLIILSRKIEDGSLIRVFDGRSMGSQGSNVSSGGKLRL